MGRAEYWIRDVIRLTIQWMIRRTPGRGADGMSLVELMIVVVIIGILAAIATVSYRRYIARARMAEPTAMLAEFAAKEQLYFLDIGEYAEAHSDVAGASKFPSDNENAREFFPHDLGVSPWDSAREPISIAGGIPQSWRALGIRPRWTALYCSYLINAGAPPILDQPAPPALPAPTGQSLWPAVPNVHWFYAIGACNFLGAAGWPNTAGEYHVTTLVLTHDSTALRIQEENE